MSQNDLVIANQSFPATRADINSALQALGSLNSGSSAPATTYANMLWYDTANNTLKMRAEANDQWISIGYLDQTADAFRIFDDTQVVNSSGTQTGLIGDQATSIWQAGTSSTESLVSPAKVAAAIGQLVDLTSFADGASGQPRIKSPALDLSYKTGTASSVGSGSFNVLTFNTSDLSNLSDMGLAYVTGNVDASSTGNFTTTITCTPGGQILRKFLPSGESERISFSALIPTGGASSISVDLGASSAGGGGSSTANAQILILGR